MKTLPREFYVPSGYVQFKPELGDYPKDLFACYVNKEKPMAVFFVGKQSKPIWHYKFKDNLEMKNKILSKIESLMSWHEKKIEKRKIKKDPTTLKEGDILYTSWGYEQTNVDWYQVTKIISHNMVEIRAIYGERSPDELMDRGTTIPKKDAFIPGIKPMRKRVGSDNTLKIETYANAWIWDGNSKYYSTYA